MLDEWALRSWLPLQIINILAMIYFDRTQTKDILAMGMMMGGGINVAHELIHKDNFTDRMIGRVLLTMVGYGHWEWQHKEGHHKNIGLEKDPASAPFGMSIYRFLPRTIVGTLYQSMNMSPLRFITTLSCSSIILIMAWKAGFLAVYLQMGAVAILLLELINYNEHYGLYRSSPDQKVNETHSWDAPYLMSSILLYKLTFHADHHLNSKKFYTELEDRTKSPRLPFPYPIMMMICLFPPIYFHLVHPLLPTHN